MFNAEKPSLEELPSSAQLLRSTVLAAICAIVVLVAVVLPAEYGIDPTGAGDVLGLIEMGEIKRELADEAERDRVNHGDQSSVMDMIFGAFVGAAHAQEAWRDTITFTLEPGAFTEVKLVMVSGDTVNYAWVADGGRINFDLHAHGDGQSHTYEKGRGETAGEGEMVAPFDGEHGWFWRNRDKADVTVTLNIQGAYGEVIRRD